MGVVVVQCWDYVMKPSRWVNGGGCCTVLELSMWVCVSGCRTVWELCDGTVQVGQWGIVVIQCGNHVLTVL